MIVKYLKNRSVMTFFFLLLFIMTGCSKYHFYNWAINHERSKADLVLMNQHTFNGQIEYLANERLNERENVVMIHGFGSDKDSWVYLAQELSEKYNIIIPDLPGHGNSYQELTLNYEISEQVKRINEFLGIIGFDRFHIIGNSMGGAIATLFSYQYGQKVKSLVILDGAGAIAKRTEFDDLLDKGEHPLIVKNFEEFQRMMNFALKKHPFIPTSILEVMAEKKIERREIDQKIFKDIWGKMDLIPILPKVTTPTLIIWGREDKILDIEDAELFNKEIPNSKMVIIDEIGHCPMIEEPKKTAKICIDFWSTL